MIYYNNLSAFTEVHLGNTNITEVYFGNVKKWPTGPQPFGGKFLVVYADSSTVSAECSSTADTIIIGEITKTLAIDITVGNCVTTIGGSAFQEFHSLETVILPDSITTIGSGAFYDSRGLKSITIYATTPPTLGDGIVFASTNNCPIYVPAASVSAYKSSSIWSAYADRIQAIP